MRIAAVADIHVSRTTGSELGAMFAAAAEQADVLVLCGDLTDYGLPEEAQKLAAELRSAVNIPVVGVLGNHDYESGKAEDVRTVLCEAGMMILDGDACEIAGVGFAGVKGFGGGFGRGTLNAWGEKVIKDFVQEAVAEQLKLEAALSRLRAGRRVALLHYSPIEATVEGEPREIHPFLGCSRLERPFERWPVDAVFHGHAHGGAPEGATKNGIPVYNVSMSSLRKAFPEKPPFRIVEL